MSNVFVIDRIWCDPQKSIDVQHCPHLHGIPVVEMSPLQKVDILIGQDNAEALVPIEVLCGKKNEPFGARTLFGWSIHGTSYNGSMEPTSHNAVSHFVSSNNIDVQISRLWNLEEQSVGPTEVGWSTEDRDVINFWNDNLCVKDGHYQLPVPWKKDVLDNNYDVASSCLRSLKATLTKSGKLDDYDCAVQMLLQKDHAEVIPEDACVNPRTWFLPHRYVMKKNGLMRLVFDCASRYRGYCLNDTVCHGPNLISKLSHILLRFRLHSYAVTADIENTYNQVLIPVEDRDALRFLWGVHNVKQYRMKTHLFRGVWCSSASTFALQQCVNQTHSSLVKHAIMNSFYVDDLAISVQYKSDVKCVIEDLKKVLLSRGFNLKKYMVNDADLMSAVPVCDRYMGMSTLLPSNGECKTLGLM